jgi:hypothetical protein
LILLLFLLLFHSRAQMFHFLCMILRRCSIFTLNTILELVSYIVLLVGTQVSA